MSRPGAFRDRRRSRPSDFQAAAAVIQSGTLSNADANGVWSVGSLNAAGIAAVNKTGTTQLRVYFAVDDNDNGRADYISYHSGEAFGGSKPAPARGVVSVTMCRR